MDTVIIGSGQVAGMMGRRMLEAGHRILQVAARNAATAAILAEQLGCGHTQDFSLMNPDGQLYMMAIADDALSLLSPSLRLGNRLVVHTAGSVSRDVLKGISTNYGVIYPLQTIRAERPDPLPFPLLVDGNTPETLTLIQDIAETLAPRVVVADDDYRRKIHLAAVVSGNFSNHLFALTENYCRREQVDFSLLLPLLRETVERMEECRAAELQTGPAMRNDRQTLAKHMAMLENYPVLKALYELISASIHQSAQNKSVDA